MKIQVVIEATSIQEYTEAIQALAAGYTVAPAPSITESLKATGEAAKAVTTGGTITGLSDAEESKPAEPKEQSWHRTAKKYYDELLGLEGGLAALKEIEKEYKVTKIVDLGKVNCAKFSTAIKEAILELQDKTKEEAPAPKEVEQVFSNDEKSEPKHGFPAVKAIAMKLNKIQDGKAEVKFLLDKFGAGKLSDLQEENYDEFHELASKAIADHDNAPVKEDKPKEEKPVETKEDKAEDKEVTLPMIRGIAKQLADQGFKDEIRQVLKDHGAASLTKIDKKDYQSVYSALVAYNG